MQTIEVCKGTVYAITSPAGCTVTNAAGNVLATVDAGVQKAVVATDAQLNVSDDTATITQVFGTSSSGIGGYTLTAEDVKDVAPLTWGAYETSPECVLNASLIFGGGSRMTDKFVGGSLIFGANSTASGGAICIGSGSTVGRNAVAIGGNVLSTGQRAIVIGAGGAALQDSVCIGQNLWPYTSRAQGLNSVAIGQGANLFANTSVLLGSQFSETVDGTNVTRTCTTEGTGSITIGAGANTLNTTDSDGTVTESSNAVTIGCKAANSGADSVVIGASAANSVAGSVVIGAGAKYNVVAANRILAIGRDAKTDSLVVGNAATSGNSSVAVGNGAKSGNYSTAIGHGCNVGAMGTAVGTGVTNTARRGSAFGYGATAADAGVVVFSSTTDAGDKTQLYFSGANTPLATTYEGGAPMLGYTVTDSAGNVTAAGTRSLLDLLTNNSTFAPATTDENGELVMPTVFHPSDLDLPAEEVTEPTEEEYTPLPVYPIVEPEIEE